MKLSSLIKAAYSLVFVLVLALAVVIISPKVAFAQGVPSNAIEILEKGIKASDKGDIGSAKYFYEDAIRQVLENQDVDILIVAKTRLANLLGDTDEAKKLRKQAEAGEEALGLIGDPGGVCGECMTSGVSGEITGSGSLRRCTKCPRP